MHVGIELYNRLPMNKQADSDSRRQFGRGIYGGATAGAGLGALLGMMLLRKRLHTGKNILTRPRLRDYAGAGLTGMVGGTAFGGTLGAMLAGPAAGHVEEDIDPKDENVLKSIARDTGKGVLYGAGAGGVTGAIADILNRGKHKPFHHTLGSAVGGALLGGISGGTVGAMRRKSLGEDPFVAAVRNGKIPKGYEDIFRQKAEEAQRR
jgi:hypothetical protein